MKMSKMSRIIISSLGAAALALTMSGCSSNAGGATTCSQFLSMSSSKQNAVAKQVMKNQGLPTGKAAVSLMAGGIQLGCAFADGDTRIDELI
ncbi:MAG: hypothetical protein FWG15_03755 [Propionibacteriaceae bacterium]|nr:hypothetical protein [Propionibacteriaceae bacterium]